MSTAQTADLPALKDQLAVLETQRQVVAIQNEIDQLMKEAEYGRVVMEAYGDWVNPQEYLTDDPSFGLGGRYVNPISRPDDRADGRYRPVFENETDLAMIRGAAHVLTTSTGSGLNILGNLTDYTIGSGFKYEAKLADEKAEDPQSDLIAAVQRVIDTFLDDNDWQSDLEREVHWRSREDGEAAIVLRPRYHSWRTQVNLLEPDQIIQPTNPRDLEEWLTRIGNQIGSDVAGQFVSSWSFGVHTRANDTAHPLGFNAVFTGGADWEYYPSEDVRLAMRLGSGVMEFIKCNVPMNVKRGVSDFYPVIATLERAEKLSKNVQVTAAIQAAIAFIRNHPKSATQSQIQSLQSGNATGTVNRQTSTGGTRSISRQKFESGTIIDTNGSEYMYGPMGQSSAPTFIDVIQSAFRAAGARWRIPEYMISSDASNNNFASILVAGSPFVQARSADQRFYVSRFVRMMWKVIRIAFENGFFDRFGIAWEQLEALIDVVCTPPDITIADELKNAQIKEAERAAGVLSLKTWRKESGRDHEEEERNIAEERANGIDIASANIGGNSGNPANKTNDPPAPTGEYKDLSRQQWKRNIKAIDDVLADVIAGRRSESMATEMLISLGLDRERAKSYIADAKDNGKVDDPEFISAVQESLALDARDARERLPSGMSLLHESAYVAALETATPEERVKLIERAWEGYP